MSVIGRSRGPWGSSLAAWEASGGVRRGPGRPQKATVLLEDSTRTRVKIGLRATGALLSIILWGRVSEPTIVHNTAHLEVHMGHCANALPTKGPRACAIALLQTAPRVVEAGTLAQIATSTRQTRPSTASNAKLAANTTWG